MIKVSMDLPLSQCNIIFLSLFSLRCLVSTYWHHLVDNGKFKTKMARENKVAFLRNALGIQTIRFSTTFPQKEEILCFSLAYLAMG